VDEDDADVGHAAAAAPLDDQVAGPQRVVGGGQEGVAPARHRRGAGVVGLPCEDQARAAHADDGIDDRDRHPRLVQPRSLLDVQLDVGVHRAGRRGRLRRPGGVEARPCHRVHEALAVDGGHGRDRRGVEPPAERA
jgi:hypothetical protein